MNKNKEEEYFLNNTTNETKNNISEEEKNQAKFTVFLMILNAIKWVCIILLAPFAIIIFAIVGAASDTSKNNRRGRRR